MAASAWPAAELSPELIMSASDEAMLPPHALEIASEMAVERSPATVPALP